MIIPFFRATCFTIVFATSGLFSTWLAAQDWPQILGPSRNGVVESEKLLLDWPAEGLERVWKKSVGQGYAGPIVQDNSVIIFHRVGKELICERLNADSGAEIWKATFPATYEGGGIDNDLGPKAVPLFHDGKVLLFSPSGHLYCLDFDDGSTVWDRPALKEYQGREGFFGAGSSPLIANGNVIVNLGGRGAGLIAFQLSDGEEVWKSVADQASYSSPILSPDGSTIIAITRFKLVGLDAASGEIKFEEDFGKRGPTVNAAMPVLADNQLFVTAAYNIGARWMKLSPSFDAVDTVWSSKESLSSQYATPIFLDGHLFGSSGREDTNDGSFRCVDTADGSVKWSVGMPVGHSFLIDGRILHIDCKSTLRIIQTDTGQFREQYQTELFPVPTRGIPAISNGRLFVRCNAFGPKGQLACFRIGNQSDD